MGEAADDVIEGRACQECGEFFQRYLTDLYWEGYGYPKTCAGCGGEEDDEDDLDEYDEEE